MRARIGLVGFRSPPGRKKVAHGESGGANGSKSPGRGDRSVWTIPRFSVATTWLSLLCLCRDPTAGAVGHILAPLTRLDLRRRAYSSDYGG